MCCFNRPYDDQGQARIKLEAEAKLEIQDWIRNEKTELVWSSVLDLENSQNQDEEIRLRIELWSGFAIVSISISDAIGKAAEGYEAIGIKPMDPLHVACAVVGEAEVFLTTDRGIVKRRDQLSEIRILNPVELMLEQQSDGDKDDD